MARTILLGKHGGPLTNTIHAASLRLEELKFGDLAGAQNHAEDVVASPTDYVALAVAECRPAPTFTHADIVEAFQRYGFNNAVSFAKANIAPLAGVQSSWLDGFVHGMGAMGGLTPKGGEMLARWERGYE
jgi:hypothetical protein